MAKRLLVHVEVQQKGWAVILESNERATSVHPTQAQAAEDGILLGATPSSTPRTEGYGSTTAMGKREQPRKEEK